MTSDDDDGERRLLRAVRRGERRATQTLVQRFPPLVHTLVGRVSNGDARTGADVRDTTLWAVRELPTPPAALAVRQLPARQHRDQGHPGFSPCRSTRPAARPPTARR